MSIAELKAKIIHNLEAVDETVLLKIDSLINKSVESNAVEEDAVEYISKQIETARAEIANGEGISHEEAMKKINAWKQK